MLFTPMVGNTIGTLLTVSKSSMHIILLAIIVKEGCGKGTYQVNATKKLDEESRPIKPIPSISKIVKTRILLVKKPLNRST